MKKNENRVSRITIPANILKLLEEVSKKIATKMIDLERTKHKQEVYSTRRKRLEFTGISKSAGSWCKT